MIADVSISISPVLHAVDFAMFFFSGAAFAAYHSVDAPCPFKKRDPFYLGLGGLGLGLVADTSYAPRGIVSRVVSWCSCEERVFCFVFWAFKR